MEVESKKVFQCMNPHCRYNARTVVIEDEEHPEYRDCPGCKSP